jgi:YafQ family addiction module toxin component
VSLYDYRLEKGLISFLNKIYKKDRKLYEAAMKKIEDISEDPHHYKPLRHDLKGRRRVHIEKSFVLTFRIDEQEKRVIFLNLCHHDHVYKKR